MEQASRKRSDGFAVVRLEKNGFSTRGPIGKLVTLKAAREEIRELARLYPYQEFAIIGIMGHAERSESVSVRIEAPEVRRRAPVVKLVPKEQFGGR